MTDTTLTDQHPRRPVFSFGRMATAGGMLVLGILAPAAAGASPADNPPGPSAADDLTIEQPCQPDLNCPQPEPDPPDDDCPPILATCDFTSGGDGPDEPPPPPPGGGEPGDGSEESTGEPVEPVEVDAPVVATPNFTG